ncbi:hypothetical protein CXB51_008020 [Gossypium anomalum]|uniref:Uncharacterized protein n=1 Tax=Gossypium anomalum TaxID=47600 RepID=A0A8J5ZA66_9ROSI|nr:hypothetical protein CXB51_008020 [Gossypium anomalum]
MASLKYEIPLLDHNTRFALWQIKMQAVLAQMDLEDALLEIDKMPSTLTDEEKKRKDRKALTQLHLHLSNEILQDVMKEKTAAALWKRLEQICMSKTLTSKLHMKQRLYAHRLEEGASVHEHLTVFKEILSNLEAMEVQYDKEDLGLILLCSLPPSYSTFRDTILYSRESLTVDEGEGLIIRVRQDRNADDDRGRTQERNPHGKSKGRSKSSNRVASVNDSKVSEEWTLDSGCTFHMSPNRDWFTTYETVSAGVVLMGNNTSCKIAGVGTIKVNMFDGVVRTLSDGSTITGNAAVASSSLSDDDITKLWHMRLGHMSENGMAELSKRGLSDGQGICKLNFCEHCVFGKQKRVRFTRGIHNTKGTLEYIHSDLWGPSRIVQVRRDHETLDSSSYSIAKRRCRTNEQNDHGEDIDANQEPSNYSEAVSCEDSEKWMFSMQEEMESLHKNRTWDLVKLPKGKKAVRCKWVFKKKEGTPGVEKPRYKARLVAKGYSQIPRVDFTDVFSPVVKYSSIRALLGIVAMHDLELEQLDVKTAFCMENLRRIFTCNNQRSPRQWYKRFDSFMTSHDFKRSSLDSCVYFKKNSDGSFVYLLLYVDDMLIAVKDKGEIRKVKAQLSEEFEMKDLGPAKKILGMEILRDRKASKLYLNRKGYIEKVLCRFNMQNAKPVSTPLAAHFRLSSALSPQSDDEIEYMSHVSYSSVVESLMYATVYLRPDLSYAVSAFGRTKDGVIGYVDADFAGGLDRIRSLTGYVFTIGGCAISWKATLQTTVALSTTEAEYMAITEAYKEAIWLKGLFSELNEDLQISTVFCDSQSAIFLTKDQMFHERTKHIDVQYHFVRDIIARGDMMTKSLPITKFEHCLDLVGVHC